LRIPPGLKLKDLRFSERWTPKAPRLPAEESAGDLVLPRALRRFDVHQNVADIRELAAHSILNFVSDFVGTLHGHLRVHLHVHVDIEMVAHLANETFFNALHSGYQSRSAADLVGELGSRGTVHQFVNGALE
jgi:hypothetical protein